MNNLKRYGSSLLILLLLLGFLVIVTMRLLGPKIGNTFSTISSCLEPCPPVPIPTNIIIPTPTGFLIPVTGGGGEFAEIDQLLSQSIGASLAYNIPSEMKVNETAAIELLLNPSLSEAELVKEITEPGAVVSGSTEITPQMKAELISPTEDAFLVTQIHDDSVQIISGVETTKWSWYLTAQKEGVQKLTIVVYRLVKFDNEDYWREVATYKADIDVKVTVTQRILMVDWKWIIGLIASPLLIAGFWRWFDGRKKKNESDENGKVKSKPPGKSNKKKS